MSHVFVSRIRTRVAFLALALALAAQATGADVVTDWNEKAAGIVTAARVSPGAQHRFMAIVQLSVYEAVSAIARRYPSYRFDLPAVPGASLEAAVAAASRKALLQLVPSQPQAIEAAYESTLSGVPAGPARAGGIEVGERAAAAVLAWAAGDGSSAPDTYRPLAAPGAYVPTATPLAPHWGSRRPWFLSRGDQFRPAPPPRLTDELYSRDYNEIKAVGGRSSSARTAEQTGIARFWEAAGAAMYFPVARSAVAGLPGRDVADNALLFAVLAMALDDALIAVWDAKYTYNFWRPVTAIRNGDSDGNEATERDASWVSLVESPLHPEYPSAHSVLAGATAAVLDSVIRGGRAPRMTSGSPSAPGVVRSWSSTADLVAEVSAARIYDGIHFRNSTVVGASMGRQVGDWAVTSFMSPALAKAGRQTGR